MVGALCEDELCPSDGDVQPLLLLVDVVVQHRESPYLPGLQPHELISVIDLAVVVNACEKAATLAINGVLLPEWDNLV